MNKAKSITSNIKQELFTRYCMIALMLTSFSAFLSTSGILTAFATGGNGGNGGNGGGTGGNTTLDSLMTTVIGLISDAALYVGIVIVLWGVFQIIMAFRREDSETIGKQITTVVVGGVLVGFKVTANNLYNTLKGPK